MKNQPFWTLITGLCIVAILALVSLPSVQNGLARFFDQNETVLASLPQKPDNWNRTEKVIVNRVVDGDTIVMSDGRTVRYLNVDTPETKKPGVKVQCFGPEASEFNKKLAESREVVLVADKESQDRYGRDLRLVFLIGRDTTDPSQSLNAEIVRNGYGRSLIIKPNDSFASVFQSLEYKAKQTKTGIWGACAKPFEE
jgi:micrococcal nuclease